MFSSAFRYVVVGSGFFGAVIAHRIATERKEPVLILEKRNHIGGNSYSQVDTQTGIEYHQYGTHLFHTSSDEVWGFVKKFSDFNNYRHRVFTRHKDKVYTMPINLQTINSFFGTDFNPSQAKDFISSLVVKENIKNPANLEEKAISLIGRDLYNAFVKEYTAKQWETDPRELPANIITRLPFRFSRNDFYFSDRYEGLPVNGYANLFQNMLNHPLIHIQIGCDFFELRETIPSDVQIIYTGPIDRFYNYKFGKLGWRTIDFETEVFNVEDYQGAAVMNYADADVPYTRIHEYKHLHPERQHQEGKTLIAREYSRFASLDDEPYYPINTDKDKKIYDMYRLLADREEKVIFGGRLGTYRYLDMHQAIGAALKTYDQLFSSKIS